MPSRRTRARLLRRHEVARWRRRRSDRVGRWYNCSEVMTRKSMPREHQIAIDRDGTRYTGTYTEQSGVVTVWYFGGTAIGGDHESSQVGASAIGTATMLLSELVTKHHRAPT